MYLIDFVEERQLNYKTVYNFISNNKSLFENKTTKKNNKIFLYQSALDILAKKYPLSVEKENTTQKQLIEAQQRIIDLQQLLVDIQPKLLLLEQQNEYLAEIESELNKKNSTIELLKQEQKQLIFEKEKEYENMQDRIDKLRESVARAKNELEQEKSKSLLARLFKK